MTHNPVMTAKGATPITTTPMNVVAMMQDWRVIGKHAFVSRLGSKRLVSPGLSGGCHDL